MPAAVQELKTELKPTEVVVQPGMNPPKFIPRIFGEGGAKSALSQLEISNMRGFWGLQTQDIFHKPPSAPAGG